MREQFRDGVGAARVERRVLVLRRLPHLAEHLGARRLVEADALVHDPDRLEHVQCAAAGNVGGGDRLHERRSDEALRRQVVDLIGLVLFQKAHASAEVRQVMLDELQPLVVLDAELCKAPEINAAAAPEGSDYHVPELEQPLRQVGSVLPRGSGDQCFFGHSIIPFMRAESCTSARPNPLRHA